jgi:hypothetical protein
LAVTGVLWKQFLQELVEVCPAVQHDADAEIPAASVGALVGEDVGTVDVTDVRAWDD